MRTTRALASLFILTIMSACGGSAEDGLYGAGAGAGGAAGALQAGGAAGEGGAAGAESDGAAGAE
ncbi:MAG: hypothetical protein KC776_25510, partial [Myxococcales bacterium]|nr:hypothetical protein [Myxococcales bacterium]